MKKKILLLTPNLSSGGGGAERQIANLAVLLKEDGFKVEVLCYEKGDFYQDLLTENNIFITWKIETNFLKRILRVRKHIRNGNYDTVISFLHTPNFLNNISAIGGKSWKVITGERNSKLATFTSRKGKIFAYFQKFSDAIVCNSNNAKEMWKKYYPQYDNKLITLYNIISIAETPTEYTPKKDGKLHIIIAASYQHTKNPLGLIKGLSMLSKSEREGIRIVWYGKNDDKHREIVFNESNKLIQENDLGSVIELLPNTKDIINLYNKADIVALFSEVEGLPNAILEGMVLGKPIIMSRVSDYSVLVDGKNGFLCDWNDPQSIKNVLISASNTPKEQLLQMGEISKEKAKRFFSKDEVRKQWVALINQ